MPFVYTPVYPNTSKYHVEQAVAGNKFADKGQGLGIRVRGLGFRD